MIEVLDTLIDPFRSGIGQRALLEIVLLGIACGPLGVWVVLSRQSYAAESLSHGALPGLVLAALSGLPLLLGAGAGLLVAALCIAFASRVDGVDPDAAVAVAITALFAAGTLLAFSPEVPARLGELLFGDPLSVSAGDLLASALLSLLVLTCLMRLHRPLALAVFDRPSAASFGADPQRLALALLVLLALTTLIAIQALGNLLVVAVLIAPAAAAVQLSGSLWRAICLSAVLATGCGIAGLYASYYLDTAAGASIALASIVPFVASLSLRGRVAAGARRGTSPVASLGGVR